MNHEPRRRARHARRSNRRPLLFTLLLVVGLALGVTGAATASAASSPESKPTIVLVHGAFADSSGWTEVTKRLQKSGYTVLAPANPLRGLGSDAAYIDRFLRTLDGPIVLVGHSYGGMVITNAATGNANVKALVYVAAFAPDEGETLGGLQLMFPGSQLGQEALDFRPYPLADGSESHEGYVKASVFREVFAGDVTAGMAEVMAATQRPADVHTLFEPSGAPAWKTVKTGYLVASADNLIPAAAQRFMAKRADAVTVEIKSSHVAMISNPGPTTDLIVRMAKTVG